jgi:hypothetical protein
MKLSGQEWQNFKMKNKEARYYGKRQLSGRRKGTKKTVTG